MGRHRNGYLHRQSESLFFDVAGLEIRTAGPPADSAADIYSHNRLADCNTEPATTQRTTATSPGGCAVIELWITRNLTFKGSKHAI